MTTKSASFTPNTDDKEQRARCPPLSWSADFQDSELGNVDRTGATPDRSNKNLTISTCRQCYTQSLLDEVYPLLHSPPSAFNVLGDQCRCSRGCVGTSLLGFFPIISVLAKYRREFVFSDIVSGLSVGFLHLPQGLGFGLLASLGAVNGLYSSFFPTLAYMLFGTSPHVSMGTNAVIALLVSCVVDREADVFLASRDGNSTALSEDQVLQYKVSVAAASSLVEGLVLVGMGLLRLGFLTNFLSHSFIEGYSFAAAVHIFVSQIVKLLNLRLKTRSGLGKLVFTTADIAENIMDTRIGDVVVGVVCGAILLAVNMGINVRYRDRMKAPVPIELIVVALSTLVSHVAQLNQRFNISVVGSIPQGMPAPSLPPVQLVPRIAGDAVMHAILVFVLTISMAKLTAKLHVITINDNQELVAYGMCQLLGSFFQCFTSSISPPRTMMLSTIGAKSTLNGLSTAFFLLLVLLVAGRLFVSLPIAMLAAMIIVAMKDLLLQVRTLKTLWYVNKGDFFIWLLTAAFSVFGDLDLGLLVGVVSSMVMVMVYSQLAKGTLLGKAAHEDLYMDMERSGIIPIPGVKIFRFESQLHFASAERFKSEMYRKIFDPTNVKRKDCYEIDMEARRRPSVFNVISSAALRRLTLLKEDTEPPAVVDQPAAVEQPSAEEQLFDVNQPSANMQPSEVSALGENVVKEQSPPRTERSPGGNEASGSLQATDRDEEPNAMSTKSIQTAPPFKNVLPEERKLAGEMGKESSRPSGRSSMEPSSPPTSVTSQRRSWASVAQDGLQYVIIDCSTMTYIDLTGVEMLHLVITQYFRAGVTTLLTDIPPTTLAILTKARFFEHESKRTVYFNILDALQAIHLMNAQRLSRKS